MNYDFRSNWNDVIVPLLSLPKVKRSIKRGIINFIKSGKSYEGAKYDKDLYPADYSTGVSFEIYIESFKEKLTEKLLSTGQLKDDENDIDPDEYDLYACYDPRYKEYMTYKNKILEPFVKHHKKNCLEAYQMFHACHWWNPTFCLTLAKIIYPNEIWSIRNGSALDGIHGHTTIINKDKKLLFDILYFDEKDETFGASKALLDSSIDTKYYD